MRLTPLEKLKIVKTVIKHKKTVLELSKEYKIGRKTIYFWVDKYSNSASRNKKNALIEKYVKGKAHPKCISIFLEEKIVRFVKKCPNASIRQIAKALKANNHAVYNALKALKLTTKDSRYGFCNIYAFPGVLAEDIKLSIVRSVQNNEKKISHLSKEYRVARKTIYKWISQYKTNGNLKTDYVCGYTHPKSYSESQVQSILGQVVKNPTFSIHSLANSVGLSSHGLFNVLKRYNLTHSIDRLSYTQAQASHAPETQQSFGIFGRVKSVFETFTPNLAPAPPPSIISLLKTFGLSFASSLILFLTVSFWYKIIFSEVSDPLQFIGLIFASIALFAGSIFLLYSFKYYISLGIVLSYSAQDEKRNFKFSIKNLINQIIGGVKITGDKALKPVGLESNMDEVVLKNKPFVSVHIPFYNEKNVVRRAIEAAVNFKYPNYEIILADDSTDETTGIIRKYQEESLFKYEKLKETHGDGWTLTEVEVKPGIMLKHIHRTSREGYKGAALDLALKLTNPKTEFVSVFDADFVPYPDTLELFLKYFQVNSEQSTLDNVAAVQGYQWHVLNKSENWITRGVRSEYAGSYVVERSGAEIYGGLKQISGSVYMIKREALESVGWGTSITEDFELTLKLYEKGYKVLYTPYIQAPSECVSTLKRLVRQRMRWAEGHSFNIKKMFWRLMLNSKITFAEKLEFFYLSPYYLQALFFLVGTFAWLVSETIFKVRIPFWTELWGWSLILTNLIALPLVNAVGLFLEDSEHKDYNGLVSFILLSYLLVPFQAYAAVKGFIEKEEGPWFRTPKTGRITDMFARSGFYRFIEGILPGKTLVSNNMFFSDNNYLALETANNQFDNFKLPPKKRMKWLGKVGLVSVVTLSILVNSFAFGVKPVKAAGWYDNNWLYRVKLTIDYTKVSAAQTDFPVYINLANMPANFHTHVNQTDARDIRVTKDDGTTELPREVIFYTAASDTGGLHFKYTGTLSSTVDTDVYIYYGNASASNYAVTDTYGRNNVWDSNYKAVWHFTESTGAHADSTVNGNNSSAVTVTTQGTANAKFGGADDFDGIDDIINNASPTSLDNLGPLTYSAWIYPNTGGEGGFGRIIDKTGSVGNQFYVFDGGPVSALKFNVDYSGIKLSVVSAANSITMNTWQLVTVTWDDSATATNVHLYVNGTEVSSYDTRINGTLNQPDDNTGNFLVGNNVGTTRTFDGQIDEVNVSGSVRSSTWISTQYNNQNSNTTFVKTWGAEEDVPELTILLFPLALAAPFIVKYMRRRKERLLAYA